MRQTAARCPSWPSGPSAPTGCSLTRQTLRPPARIGRGAGLQPLLDQRVCRSIDIEIEAKRQEMIVVDRDQVRGDQRAVSGIAGSRRISHRARRDALDGIDAGRADIDTDRAALGQHPVDHIVVIAEARDRAHHQFAGRTAGVQAVFALGMAPQRRPGAALEQAGDRAGLARPPCCIRKDGVEHRGAGRTIDTRLQRRGRCPEPVLADIEPGAKAPGGRGVHIRHEHLGDRAAVKDEAFAPGILVPDQRQHEPGARLDAVVKRPSVPAHKMTPRAQIHVVPLQRPASPPDHATAVHRNHRSRAPSLTGPVSISRITRLSSRSTTATTPSIGRAQKLLVPAASKQATRTRRRPSSLGSPILPAEKADANDSIESVKAAAAHRFLPSGIFHCYPLSRCPLLGRNCTLHPRYRRPAFDAAGGKLDHRFIDDAVAAQDDKGPPRERLPRFRSQYRRLVRLVEVDRRKARAAIGISGGAQHRHDRLDLGRGQRVERVESGTRGNGGNGLHQISDRHRRSRQPAQPVAGGGRPRLPAHSLRGSSTSRSPSPNRFSDRTRLKIAIPGQKAIHGACDMKLRAVFSMLPQLGLGGCCPRPRKDRLASAMIAVAAARVA